MIAAAAGGCVLLLAAALLVAGVRKLIRLRASAAAIDRLLPAGLPLRSRFARAAAPVIGGAEVATGTGLLWSSPPAVSLAAWTLGLFVGFVLVVAAAIRKQTGCGCFAAHPDDVAAGAELARAVGFAVVAAGDLALAVTGRAGWTWSPGAAVGALALGCAMAALTLVGGGRPGRRRGGRSAAGPGPLRGAERAARLLALEAAPSVRALRVRLGPRAADLDLRRSVITAPAGPHWLVVTPPRGRGLQVRMSVPWDGERTGDAVITAVIDGEPLLVSGGVVRDAPAAAAG